MDTQELTETHEDRLVRLGMGAAAKKLKDARELKRKLAVAYEHYRFVTQDKVDAFNRKLYAQSEKDGGRRTMSGAFQELRFTGLKDYEKVPPGDVLIALEAAHERKCFDSFEVADIREVKDPILFGRIAGCPDRFFVAQWDDDVKIEDILSPREG